MSDRMHQRRHGNESLDDVKKEAHFPQQSYLLEILWLIS